jgi:CRP-like cAMP-binding protein
MSEDACRSPLRRQSLRAAIRPGIKRSAHDSHSEFSQPISFLWPEIERRCGGGLLTEFRQGMGSLMTSFADQVRARNGLLATLPAADAQRIVPRLTPVELERRQILYEPGTPIRYAYFPEQGLISVVNTMHDGSTIEVGTIGCEGMSGLPLVCGVDSSPHRHMVQISGRALRMNAADLRDELQRDTPMRRVLFRYHAAFTSQIMQSVACNGLHTVQERCCRWLLLCSDRSPTPEVVITHEFLAQMLGVRRATVTELLKPLQNEGLIRYRRGMVAVVDRLRLEQASCECYRAIRDEFSRLLPVEC